VNAGWNKRGVYSGVKQNGIIDERGTTSVREQEKVVDKN
jgi:hypothetical protein